MSCKDRELQIALYSGGDLPSGEVAEVEKHLGACAECRQLVSDFLASRAALAENARDADEFAASAVRHRVMAELRGRERRRGLVPVLTAAFSVAAIIVAILIAPRDAATLQVIPAAPAVAQLPIAERPAGQRAPVAVAKHVRRPLRPAKLESPEPEEPILVKLETDDPNIVIYWITD
jgi:anti-sigma factor RsiW